MEGTPFPYRQKTHASVTLHVYGDGTTIEARSGETADWLDLDGTGIFFHDAEQVYATIAALHRLVLLMKDRQKGQVAA